MNIICLQETAWVDEKSCEIENIGYKILYTRIERNRNGVGILINNILKENVTNIKGVGDKIVL